MSIAHILLVTWAALCVAGGLVLLLLDTPGRRMLFPALPAVGAMALAALLHWPGLWMGTRAGLVILVPAAVVVAVWRRPRTARLPTTAVPLLLLATLAGIPALVVGLIPQTKVDGPRVVQPTTNNDAYAYVTLTDWLENHAATERPSRPPRPPVYAYTRSHLGQGLRVGEELVQATAATVVGREPDITWYTVTSLWLLFLPGVMAAAAQVLGFSVWAGMAAGVVTGLSALTTGQLYNQNSASLLGMAVVPITLALLLAAVFETGPWRPPSWLVGLSVAGLFGVYSEYLSIVGLGLVFGFLATALPKGFTVLGRSLRKCVHIGLWAVVLSPLVWYNLVRGLLLEYRIANTAWISPFLDTPGWAVIDRYAGVSALRSVARPSVLGPVICAGITLGIVAALWSAAGRRLAAYLVASALLIYVMSFVRPYSYAQQRAIEISLPLVLLAAAAGFSTLLQFIRARSRHLAALGIVALGVLLAAFASANIRTARQTASSPYVTGRTIDSDFYEAVGWLRNVVRDDGQNLLVLDPDFFQQLWIIYLLKEWPQVDYPFIFPDYNKDLEGLGLWDMELRPYVLVGTHGFVDADPGVVMAENDRYRLLDLSKGQALVAMPIGGFAYEQFTPERQYLQWMVSEARLLFFRTPGYPRGVALSGTARPDLGPLGVRATTPGGAVVGDAIVTGDPSRLLLELPEPALSEVVLTNTEKVLGPEADLNRRSFLLTSVSRR